MPIELTEDYKKKRLIELGLDPNAYDLVPGGVESPEAPVVEKSSALDAGITGARRNIGATVGGIGATATALALLPEPTGLSKLAAAILAGLGGAYAGGKLQEAVEPTIRGEDELATQQRLAKESELAQQHPIANFAGETAPSLLAFRPSISGIRNAGKGLVNLSRNSGIELTTAQKIALANAGINAGLGGGISVAGDLIADEDINIPRALGHAAVNALISEPHAVGRKLGFVNSPKEVDYSGARTSIPIEPKVAPEPTSATAYADKDISPFEEQLTKSFSARKKQQDFGKAIVEKHFADTDAEPNVSGIKPNKVGEAKPLTENQIKITKDSLEQELLKNQVPRVTVKDSTAPDYTGNIQKANEDIANITDADDYDNLYQPVNNVESGNYWISSSGDLSKKYKTHYEGAEEVSGVKVNTDTGYDPIFNKGFARVHNGQSRIYVNSKNLTQYQIRKLKNLAIEQNKSLVWDKGDFKDYKVLYDPKNPELYQPLDKLDTITARRNVIKQSLKDNPPAKEQPTAEPVLTKPSLTKAISQEEAELLARENIEAKAKEVVDDEGNRARGVAKVGSPNREINVDTEHALEDTIYHEVAHHRLREALADPRDSKLAKSMLDRFGGDEEALIQATGEQYADRVKIPGTASALKNWWKDFTGGIKGDSARMLSAKLKYDAPYQQREARRGVAGKLNIKPENLQQADNKEIKIEDIVYNGKMGGDVMPNGKKLAELHLFTIQSDKYPNLLKGSTYSSKTLETLGYKIPNNMKPKVKYNADGSEKTENLYQKIDRSKDFSTAVEREINTKENPYGLVIANDGTLPVENLISKIKKSSQVTGGEYHALVDAGLLEFIGNKKRINVSELNDWIKENGPKVEVRKAGEGTQDPELVEHGELTHKVYDALTRDGKNDIADIINGDKTIDEILFQKWGIVDDVANKQYIKDFRRFIELEKKLDIGDLKYNPSATHWQQVGPLEKMPGYVEIAVVKPLRNKPDAKMLGDIFGNDAIGEAARLANGEKFASSHSFPPNTVVWVRGFIEEHPTEGKIFRIIEEQSDWAQQVRRLKEKQWSLLDANKAYSIKDFPTKDALLTYTKDRGITNLEGRVKNNDIKSNDPLLEYYESLGIKAAIQHARDLGITKIAIDDAETAMLTEGHDRTVKKYKVIENIAEVKDSVQKDFIEKYPHLKDKYEIDEIKEHTVNEEQLGDYPLGVINKKTGEIVANLARATGDSFKLPYRKIFALDKYQNNFDLLESNVPFKLIEKQTAIAQAPGMTQYYDVTYPNILRNITGDVGKKVEFGEHKMAVEKMSVEEGFESKQMAEDRLKAITEQGGKGKVEVQGPSSKYWRVVYDSMPREDLIFKNSDGTPKVKSSSLVFDISDIPIERPAQMFRSNMYQRITTGEPSIDNFKPGIERSAVDNRSIGKRVLDRLNPFNLVKGELQKVSEIDNTNGPRLAQAIESQRREYTNLEGQFRNIVDVFSNLSKAESDLLYRTLLAENAEGKSFKDKLPTHLQKPYEDYRATLDSIVDIQNANGELVKEYIKKPTGGYEIVMRPRKKNPTYMYNVVSGDVIEALQRPDSSIAKQLKEDLINHYVKHYKHDGKKLGEEAFREFMENDGRGGDSVKFGPNRKAEGIGLPASWIESNPINASRRYLRRTANDLAFFKHIESDPEIARMAGIDRDQNGNVNPKTVPDLHNIPAVSNILDIITGRSYSKTPVLDAASGIANSLLLGPVSGLADLVSVPFNAIKYAPSVFDIPGVVVNGLKNFRKGLRDSYETGLNKHDPIILKDLFIPTSRLAQKLTDIRDVIYRIQGRKHLEQWSRGLSQSMMQYAVEINIVKAKNGDKSAQDFLRKLLGNKVDFDNIDIKKAATSAAELLQGTYDFRNLPMWAIDSNISPFFRLARWNIEQLNNWGKYVWEPAKKGNFTPLILSTLGAVAGGAVIKQMRESAADKKAYVATFEEIVNSSRGVEGNLPLIAYKLIALASYTGYAGIASDLARSAMDVVLLKNKPQSVDFPFWGMIEDSTTKVMQAITALKDNEADFLNTAINLSGDLLKDNMQLARLANTWLIENTGLNEKGLEKRDRAEKGRDLRSFKQVEGLPVSPLANMGVNPYARKDIREFKQERDLGQARVQAKELTAKAFDRNSNNIPKVARELSGIRRNQYATMPNPKENPTEFRDYLNYIRKTQGEEAARKLLQDYIKQNKINSVKRDMIPKLNS